MKFISKAFTFTTLLSLLTSCDILPPDDDRSFSFNRLTIDKQFLLNEKWYYSGASVDERIDNLGNEVRARNLREDLPICELDNFMVFNSQDNDNLEIDFGSEICATDAENIFNYNIDNSSKTLTLGYLIGGFRNVTLTDVIFFKEIEDSSNKQINFNLRTTIEGEEVTVSYNLINSIL